MNTDTTDERRLLLNGDGDNLVAVIRANINRVQERMAKAAWKAGRRAEEVRLVVVTKMHPVETVRAAVQAGAVYLGENYAEEAVEKINGLAGVGKVEWHMIGHVQSRKARLVCAHFDLVHSLDSLRLAERLDRQASELGKVMPVLLELNLGDEESKSGWAVAEDDLSQALLDELGQVAALPHLRVLGLMSMPPLFDDPDLARPYFKRLRELQGLLAARFPQVTWRELSMGTSTDFETAIQEGATMVRIGQAILGPRPSKSIKYNEKNG
jgi:pyridoxal phosphate enzyme (YggS family)